MAFKVTPFCMKPAVLMNNPMAMLARPSKHTVFVLDHYEQRQEVTSEAAEDAHAACKYAWKVFQNIDEDWHTPDGGHSLMVGDMVRVIDDTGETTWWICCSIGWAETVAPSEDTIQVIEE